MKHSLAAFRPMGSLPLGVLSVLMVLSSCARMGQPDGGWYDETPPRVVSTSPAEGATGVKAKRVYINFDEFIQIENATENVIISPPQIEAPEIKAQGKRIEVKLQDSLKANTTYTIDFSDAISDNNENNPLGNYIYSFSTGEAIDTMEVAGYVLNAEDLEPVKGISVGLYSDLADSAFQHQPMLRVGRTDGNGHFVIRGVAPGKYRIYALQDMDANFTYTQKSEQIGFSHDIIVPSSKPDIRQDTLWRDSLHIENIRQVPYTHFLPDDIVLRAFTAKLTDRYFIKSERTLANHFSLFFSYGSKALPTIKGLNFSADSAFIIEPSEHRDTITYWLRDTTLVNQDTLRLQLSYEATDSLGHLQPQTDTLEILSKQPYEKRMKDRQKQLQRWLKKKEKAEKRDKPFTLPRPHDDLTVNIDAPSQLDPDRNIFFRFASPLQSVDTTKLHLYSKIDTLWYQARYRWLPVAGRARTYELMGEWRPDVEYSLEIDSAAFRDIYGLVSDKQKLGFKVRSLDAYSSLLLTVQGMEGQPIVVELLNEGDRVVKRVATKTGVAEFYYVNPGTYYLRLLVDKNDNGRWDTGDYEADSQPEEVYYYPESIDCKAKWDVTRSWRPTEKPLFEQKPRKLVKQKGEQKRQIRRRNAERARKLGIPLPAKLRQR